MINKKYEWIFLNATCENNPPNSGPYYVTVENIVTKERFVWMDCYIKSWNCWHELNNIFSPYQSNSFRVVAWLPYPELNDNKWLSCNSNNPSYNGFYYVIAKNTKAKKIAVQVDCYMKDESIWLNLDKSDTYKIVAWYPCPTPA